MYKLGLDWVVSIKKNWYELFSLFLKKEIVFNPSHFSCLYKLQVRLYYHSCINTLLTSVNTFFILDNSSYDNDVLN